MALPTTIVFKAFLYHLTFIHKASQNNIFRCNSLNLFDVANKRINKFEIQWKVTVRNLIIHRIVILNAFISYQAFTKWKPTGNLFPRTLKWIFLKNSVIVSETAGRDKIRTLKSEENITTLVSGQLPMKMKKGIIPIKRCREWDHRPWENHHVKGAKMPSSLDE